MRTIQATVVAKEKIRQTFIFYILCGSIFCCRRIFKHVLVTVLNSNEQVDIRGAEPTGEKCCF